MASADCGKNTAFATTKDSKETPDDTWIAGASRLIQEHGPSHLQDFLNSNLESWKKVDIHVGITGQSGAGKSSLINAMRGLNGDDAGAAQVGVVQTTFKVKCYPHPRNNQLKAWDLPGVGTLEFPRKSYKKLVNFLKYDFFVLVSCDSFTDDDMWLAKEIQRLGKSFFFVHSKLDEQLENDQEAHADTHDQDGLIRSIRADCAKKLTAAGFDEPQVFLISNFHPALWDFPIMMTRFEECLPEQKRESWLLSMKAFSVAAIKDKRNALQSKVWMAALTSAGASAAPIPALDLVVDTAILVSYQNFYIEQFGLDDNTLNNIASWSGKSVQDMKQQFLPQITSIVKNGVEYLLKEFATIVTAETSVKYLPIVGNMVSGVLSFGVIFAVLNDILNKAESEAIKLMQFVITEESMY